MGEKWEMLVLSAAAINIFSAAGKHTLELREFLRARGAYPRMAMPSVDDLMEAAVPLILADCWEPVNIIILHSGIMHYIFRKIATPKEPA